MENGMSKYPALVRTGRLDLGRTRDIEEQNTSISIAGIYHFDK